MGFVSVSVAHIKNNRRTDGVFRAELKGRGNCILPFTSNDIYDSFPLLKKGKDNAKEKWNGEMKNSNNDDNPLKLFVNTPFLRHRLKVSRNSCWDICRSCILRSTRQHSNKVWLALLILMWQTGNDYKKKTKGCMNASKCKMFSRKSSALKSVL